MIFRPFTRPPQRPPDLSSESWMGLFPNVNLPFPSVCMYQLHGWPFSFCSKAKTSQWVVYIVHWTSGLASAAAHPLKGRSWPWKGHHWLAGWRERERRGGRMLSAARITSNQRHKKRSLSKNRFLSLSTAAVCRAEQSWLDPPSPPPGWIHV